MTARVDREAVQAELLDLLDEIEQREEELREHSKKAREAIAQVRGQAKERRDILAGKRGVQLPLTVTVLEAAGKVAKRRKPEASEQLDAIPVEDCLACGVPADAPSDGCDECNHPKPAVKVHRTRGELTAWTLDQRAGRVPGFVVDQTGITTKAGILAKYGEGARFEKGTPTPQAKGGRP